MITRRGFLAWASTALPVALVIRRAHAASISALSSPAAPAAVLRALGDVVLPSELGGDGIANAVASFVAWMRGYREGAELTHAYGSSRIRYSGPTPVTRWTAQLDALENAARKQYGRAFASLPREQREALIRAALAGARLDRMPPVNEADHVAVALLAHFYSSTGATDLCYGAVINRESCRPLAQSGRRPLPLHGASAATSLRG